MNKVHTDILLLLRAAEKYGLDEASLLTDLRQARHRDLTAPALEHALRALADKSLVAPFTSPLSGKRWRILGLGTSALEEEGL